jgi:signal transduction histidine kinase/putative methionine-R-sulfoxide reductase with GAF domain
MLAQAVLALRSTADLGTACAIAGDCAVGALDGTEYRLLRLDPRSGALRMLEPSGVETPYLAESGGPVESVLRHESACFDEGAGGMTSPRETLLWVNPPAALATLPLYSGSTLFGCLLVSFRAPTTFGADARLFLQVLADSLATALERSELQRQLDEERHRRDELERRLNLDEEASASLMSVVAHELRTPLTSIKAYTETLLDTLDNPHTPREKFLGIINSECDRLTRLVRDILDLSRLEAGQRPLQLARFELDRVVRDVIDSLEAVARPRRLVIEAVIEPGLMVEADPDLVRRLMVNLIANALKYSPDGGRVRVGASADGETWSAAVEDQGPGIPPEDQARIFERFFRGRQGGQETEGTGLGLAISRGIVELHGGRLWVESPPVGGSRFCMSLPLKQTASAPARRIARQILSRRDLRELFDVTVEMVAAAMDAEIVSLMLVDPERGDLFIAAARGLEGQNLMVRRTTVRSGVAGSVAAWGRPVLVNNIETDRRFRRLNHPQYSTKSLLCVPLRVEGEVLGVINVNNKSSREAFDDSDLAVLVALVERVGSAVERAYAYPDSGQAIEEAIDTIRSVTRLRREGLLGTKRGVRMARALARTLGMSPTDVDVVGYVATIHDLGMSSIHRHLDSVPGPLDQDERHALIQHPEVSVEMIRPLEYLGSVRELILAHHERWDGTGYPRGARAEEIPLGARILAVVDAYESMTAGRPWRAARGHDDTLAELRQEAGRQFDPEVVEALARLMPEGRLP